MSFSRDVDCASQQPGIRCPLCQIVKRERVAMKFPVTVIIAFHSFCTMCCAEWPALPDLNGAVEIPAQEWPQQPGPRSVRVRISYPDGTLAGVSEKTGVMLTLHNWGVKTAWERPVPTCWPHDSTSSLFA